MFISFEGIDFSGKTTQIERLALWFSQHGRHCTIVREPGGTVLSEKIRSLLLDDIHSTIHPITELLLFSAARSQLVDEIIAPALQQGHCVIADRFFDSTTAYQGFGRGLDIDRILSLHEIAAHGISPDLTFFLDINLETTTQRRILAGRNTDRIEQADTTFFERVRKGYNTLACQYPSRIKVLDGSQSIDSLALRIQKLVEAYQQ